MLQLSQNYLDCVNVFHDLNLSELCQKYPHMPKISPGGLSVCSINYVHTYIYILGLRKNQQLFHINLFFCYVVTNDNMSVSIKFHIILRNIEDTPQIHTFTIEK